MISIETEHFRLNRILLLAVGLWPSQDSKLTRLQPMLFSSVVVTYIIFQFTVFLTPNCTTDIMMEVLAIGFTYIVYTIMYIGFYINAETIINALKQLQHICNELNDLNEIAIIKKYNFYGKCYTIFFTASLMCGLLARIFSPYLPLVLDIVLPLIEPRPRRLLIRTEYFIDQQKYFYLLELHAQLAVYILSISLIAIGTFAIVYFQHACGMFKIVSYRIKHAMATNTLRDINLKKKNLIYDGMTNAIDMHRKAMKFSIVLITTFNEWFFILAMMMVIAISLNLTQVMKTLSSKKISAEFLIPFFALIIQYTYVFMGNYMMQEIMDHNNQIFVTIYNLRWYMAPLHIQGLILFLLQRSAKSFHIKIGGMFIPSLKGFGTMMNATLSYFTFIYATSF